MRNDLLQTNCLFELRRWMESRFNIKLTYFSTNLKFTYFSKTLINVYFSKIVVT